MADTDVQSAKSGVNGVNNGIYVDLVGRVITNGTDDFDNDVSSILMDVRGYNNLSLNLDNNSTLILTIIGAYKEYGDLSELVEDDFRIQWATAGAASDYTYTQNLTGNTRFFSGTAIWLALRNSGSDITITAGSLRALNNPNS